MITSIPAALIRLATGLFFAALYAGLSSKFPVSNIRLDSFAVRASPHTIMHAGTVVNLVHQGVHATMHQYLRSH